MSNYIHASDCALHNEPAIPAAPCDCVPLQDLGHAMSAVLWMAEEWFEHNGSEQTCAEGHRAALDHAACLLQAALATLQPADPRQGGDACGSVHDSAAIAQGEAA